MHEDCNVIEHLFEFKWFGNERIDPWKLVKPRQRVRQGKDDQPATRSWGKRLLQLMHLFAQPFFTG